MLCELCVFEVDVVCGVCSVFQQIDSNDVIVPSLSLLPSFLI